MRIPDIVHRDIVLSMAEARPYSFWETVRLDARRVGHKIDPKAPLLVRLIQVRRATRINIGFACVFWLRVNQHFVRKGWPGQSRIYLWRQYRFANDISPYAEIGPGLWLPHPYDVTIGASAKIGMDARLFNGVTISGFTGYTGTPCLGDCVTVYTGAKIIKKITIGDNSIIGALALCNTDVPADSVMYGIPPNVTIRPLSDELARSHQKLPTE